MAAWFLLATSMVGQPAPAPERFVGPDKTFAVEFPGPARETQLSPVKGEGTEGIVRARYSCKPKGNEEFVVQTFKYPKGRVPNRAMAAQQLAHQQMMALGAQAHCRLVQERVFQVEGRPGVEMAFELTPKGSQGRLVFYWARVVFSEETGHLLLVELPAGIDATARARAFLDSLTFPIST